MVLRKLIVDVSPQVIAHQSGIAATVDEGVPNHYTRTPDYPRDRMRLLKRLRAWLKQRVKDVPTEVAVCEFDCRVLDCRHAS